MNGTRRWHQITSKPTGMQFRAGGRRNADSHRPTDPLPFLKRHCSGPSRFKERTMRRLLLGAVVLAALAHGPLPVHADEPKDKTPFKYLKYRLIGPYAGGRVTRSCGVPGDPLTYYLAAAA